MSDPLLFQRVHAQLNLPLDPLLSPSRLKTWAENYLIAMQVEGKSPRYIELLGMVLNRYLKVVGTNVPNTSDIRLFMLELQQSNLAPATLNIYHRTLKTFYTWLVNEGELDRNPMQTIRPPKIPRKVIAAFSVEDIHKFLKLTEGERFTEIRNRAIVLILLDTGLRRHELWGIMLEDLDVGRGTIKVMGKGSKERQVRFGDATKKAMLKYLIARREVSCSEFWLTEERRPMSEDGMKTTIRHLCDRAKITDCRDSAHTFRHTAAITILRNGGDLKTLQVMLGHSDIKTTQKYLGGIGIDDVIRMHRTAGPVDRLFQK